MRPRSAFRAGFNPDCRAVLFGELFFTERINGILQQVHQHVDQFTPVRPDHLLRREILLDVNHAFPFTGQKAQ